MTGISFGISVEVCLAVFRTEVVFLSVISTRKLRRPPRDLHPTDRIKDHLVLFHKSYGVAPFVAISLTCPRPERGSLES